MMHFFWPRKPGIESLGIISNSAVFQVRFKKIWYQNIKWLRKASHISETMSGENCPIFRISLFSRVDLHSDILKLWDNGEEFWNGVFCMLLPGALARWGMKPAPLNYTLRKKKCNFPTFSGVEFLLFYLYSNFWVLQENHEQFWNLHSSQKETHRGKLCFFFGRV